MQFQLFDNFQQLQARRQDWDRVAGPQPFSRWAWLGNWFQYLGGQHQPAVLVATQDDQWVGIAPFMIAGDSIERKLRFWGSGTACTDYTGLICDDKFRQQFTLGVADWLTTALASGGHFCDIDLIELEGIALQTDAEKFLIESFDANGFHCHSRELEGCWVASLPASWEQLNQQFSKSMRRKTKKAVQRTTDPRCQIRSTKETPFEELWPVFVQLHQARRQMVGQPGCFASKDFKSFLKSAVQDLVAERRAEIVTIDFQQQPLASMLLMNDVYTNYMYQSGVDVTRMNLEPGYQTALIAIQRSIDNGFENFDFMRGDEAYKARWATTRQPLYCARLIPRKLIARFKHNVWLTSRAIKHRLFSSGG